MSGSEQFAAFFDGRVSFRSRMPLKWVRFETALDDGQLAALNEQNLALLRAVAALEERHTDTSDTQQVAFSPELQRLEAKVDLLLTLVGQIRSADGLIPPSHSIELAAEGAAWWPKDGEQDPKDAEGMLELSLAAYATQPLILPARIQAHGEWEGRPAVLGQFFGLNETCLDALGKFVFRHHRRAIAGARQG
ncbi:PilZ domain-containing protein [Gammaproteobacteria bacterium AB-CW1]|uniref:PilZ domain-containing protein n=1 Tax=Natronospira elongata TaxID=3110268 RepID=A0AAP6MLP1_9GAMM|nr:PilZ domain-containing protein [Gammaproteobacteria bacterium AB-CW1]